MFKKALLIFILTTSSAMAQQATTPPPSSGSDKLDVKKLEQKYWAAKDDDFSVVQNRRYTKAGRFYLDVSEGIPFNDPFSTGQMTAGQIGYFFNERWGVDFNYTKANLHDNDAMSSFKSQFGGVIPNHNVFTGSQMASVTYVPLYAKMSWLDSSIIYFDMGVSVGAGMTDYDIAREEGNTHNSALAYQVGVNEQIFFAEHWALRFDLLNNFTNEKQQIYSASRGSATLSNKMINDSSMILGITYWH